MCAVVDRSALPLCGVGDAAVEVLQDVKLRQHVRLSASFNFIRSPDQDQIGGRQTAVLAPSSATKSKSSAGQDVSH